MVASVWRHRSLFATLVHREIVGRYKGSLLGVLWSFLTPLLMVTVFTFVFGEVFQSRWPGSQQAGGIDFAAALFAGLLVYTLFSDAMSKAPSLIIGQANYVKKVVFPLDIIAWVSVTASFVQWLAAYLILVLLLVFSSWGVNVDMLLLTPLLLLPYLLMLVGLSWMVSAVCVYFRDLSHLVQPLLTALLFLSPVFYAVSSVPESVRWLYALNPITEMIDAVRAMVLQHAWPQWASYARLWAFSLVTLMLGFVFFQKTRKGFADVV
jgi:lipopolysaccharide transport system permease protein